MINSVQNFENVERKPFTELKRKGNYYLTEKTAGDIFETVEEVKEKKGRKVGIIIAASSVLAGLTIFAATKGLPKNTYKWMERLGQSLEERLNSRNLRSKSGPVTSFYRYLLKKSGSFSEKSKSINNLTSFKDLLFGNLMSKNAITRKIHTGITSLFERMAKSTVDRSYSSADNKFRRLFDAYSKVNKRVQQSIPEAPAKVREISVRVDKVKARLDEGFSSGARESRYLMMKQAGGKEFGKDVWEILSRGNDARKFTTFVSENLLAADKIAIADRVNILRHSITHDALDTYRASKQAVDNIAAFIEPADNVSRVILKKLRNMLSTYKKLSGPSDDILRANVNSEIISELKLLSERLKVSDFNYNEAAVSQITRYVEDIEKTLSKGSKGELQEILTVYKSILPQKDYLKLCTKTNSAIKAFDKAIKKENDQFFDKLRDLRLGSAPTDILSIAGSIGGAGFALTLADDRDERISAALKYGIPIVGGVAASVSMTICLIAGFKAMAAGVLSSIALSKIGGRVDKFRKLYNKKHEDNLHAEAVKAEINAQKV